VNARVVLGLITLVLLAMVLVGVAPRQAGWAAGTPVPAGGVTRAVLAGASPVSAPDQSLELVRTVIAPNTALAAHTHPGTQAAYIESGDLTYTVVEGEARIIRAGAGGTPGTSETLAPGTTVLRPGDAVIETEGMVHFGENLGTEPVVILAVTLHDAALPAAIVIEPQATPTGS